MGVLDKPEVIDILFKTGFWFLIKPIRLYIKTTLVAENALGNWVSLIPLINILSVKLLEVKDLKRERLNG